MAIPTTRQIIFRITSIIAMVELAIMLTFAYFPFTIEELYIEALLDVALLAMVSTPIIYYWIIAPYVIEHEKARNEINHIACHDPLTQIANRRLLTEYLSKLQSSFNRNNTFGAVMYIDLNQFKSVNDQYGHDTGDAILVETANRLKAFVRNEDIVSRVGGDEFVIVLNQLDSNNVAARNKAQIICEKIHEKLNEPIDFKDKSFNIRSSIGVRLLSPNEASIDSIINDADSAMYRAKQSGSDSISAFA